MSDMMSPVMVTPKTSNPTSKIKAARERAEIKIKRLMMDLDPSGYNAASYDKYFATMNDNQFVDFMKKMRDDEHFNLFFEMGLLDKKNSPSLAKIKKVAEKYNIPLREYVAFPYKNPEDPENTPISATPIPVIMVLVRPLQQMLDKKNSMVSNTDSVNILTGQVTGKSKAASLSNMQTISLTTSGQLKAVKELLGPRSDDQVSKMKMLETIEAQGDYDIDDIQLRSKDKQSLETMRVMLIGAGLRVSYGKNEKLSYVLPI